MQKRNRMLRKSLAVILSLSMISTMTVFNVTKTSTEPLSKVNVGQSNPSDSMGKTYSLDEIYTGYLFSHTDKSSEMEYEGTVENVVSNANDDSVYADFHFSQVQDDDTTSGTSDSMSKKAEDISKDESTTNPLSGLSIVNPDEFLLGQINRYDQHEGSISIFNDSEKYINEFPNEIDQLPKAFDDCSLSEEKAGQTHNTIGIDYDGDGADELAYFSLYSSDDEGSASVRTYDRVEKSGSDSVKYYWEQIQDTGITISDNDDILDIECQQSKGYTAMAAGDYDNDGKEELACYFPCANDGHGEPFIGIIDINDDGSFNLDSMSKINLSSVRSGLDNLQNDGKHKYEKYYMPVVSLSTTSIRANEENVTSDSHDDLVINVSVPRVYYDNDVNMNSCTAIFSYNNSKYEKLFSSDSKFGDERMISTNSVDADLNGDGYNELVVAGMRETGVSGDKKTGTIETGKNLVQLIYWDGSNYNFVWDNPKNVEASGQVKVDNDIQEPVAITAGRYSPNTISTMDYVCIQGVILSCDNTKVYGVETTAAKDTEINKPVVNTLPHHEKELFEQAEFKTEHKVDISGYSKTHAFISTADSGFFYTIGDLQTIALLVGDESSTDNDYIYYDVVFVACDKDGNWIEKCYNDIIDREDEDDKGTYMSINFLDCDKDQIYYKYKGKAVGYSSPTLYSVIQAPPYYKEANSASVSYTITHGDVSAVKENWGIGGGLGVAFKAPISDYTANLVGKYTGSHSQSTSKSTSTTLALFPDQDYAVSFVIPVIIYSYLIYNPDGNNGKGEWTEMMTSEELPPVLSALPISTYNKLAGELEDEEQKKCAPVIEEDDLPKSSAGDPYGYNTKISDLKDEIVEHQDDPVKLNETEILVNNDTESKSNSVAITNTTENSNGFSLAMSATLRLYAVTVSFNWDFSMNWVSSNSDGISFSIKYNALPKSNKGNINTSTSNKYIDYRDSYGNIMDSNIYHYNYVDYTYYSNAVVYPSDKFADSDDVKNGVYLCSYYTHDFGGKPAELPEYFGVQSVTENEDNTYNITLAWKNAVRNKERKPDAYNIYVKSLNSDALNLVNTEGPVIFNDDALIMTYEAKNLSNSNKDYVFYIAAANTKCSDGANSSKVMNVYESILQPATKINIDEFLASDGLTITSQPKNVYVKTIGDYAEFSIDAEDKKGDAKSIYYQWETYDSNSKKWIEVTDNKSNDPKKYVFETTEESIGKPVRCTVTKNKSSGENYTATSDIVTVLTEKKHVYSQNGFCIHCGNYEPAKYEADTDVYEIGNGGQLFWFASLVNNDNSLADFDSRKQDAKGVLTADIDLENREWKPIMDFSGTFDGNNHTISNFKINETTTNSGLFGTASGTIKNFSLRGEIKLSADGDKIGGVVGCGDGATVSNVTSYVNISNTDGVLKHIGGVVGCIDNNITVVEKCMYYGTVDIQNSHDCIGGIVGYTNGGARISSCANLGTVKASKDGAYVGGILGYINDTKPTLKNCYNYGKVSNGDNKTYCGAIIGWERKSNKDNITDNYYLDTSSALPFGSDSKSGLSAVSKTAEEFKSGEVAYLLNNGVTNDTQVWYQNIDNNEIHDDYPKFEGGTVYFISQNNIYSNYDKEPVSKTYEIYTFEDFKKIPEIVEKDNKANFKLMNTIFGNGETLTEPIGSAENPYNGTFDGQGYYVYHFDMKPADGNAALFDTIGEQGSIKNLGVFYQTVEGEKAAGIAITNNGLIDECISGSNLTGCVIDKVTNKPIQLTETTTFVNAQNMAGGVVVENNGIIRNTSNYAQATAVATDGIAGGIAAINDGTIENCLNIGKMKAGENGIAGGIAGMLSENGTIQIAYCASTSIEGATAGAVFGQSADASVRSRDEAVKETYYLDTLAGDEGQGTAKTEKEMTSDSFNEELNSLSAGKEGLRSWARSDTKNLGYPRIISSQICETELSNTSKGVTVKGYMHKDAQLQLTELNKYNETYQEFQEYAEKSDKEILYCGEPALVYSDGQLAPYEESLNVKLDLSKYSGKGYKVLVCRNDKVEEIEINKQLIASKDVKELAPFAILVEKDGLSKVVDNVNTGDNSNLFLWTSLFVVAGFVAGGTIYRGKKRVK